MHNWFWSYSVPTPPSLPQDSSSFSTSHLLLSSFCYKLLVSNSAVHGLMGVEPWGGHGQPTANTRLKKTSLPFLKQVKITAVTVNQAIISYGSVKHLMEWERGNKTPFGECCSTPGGGGQGSVAWESTNARKLDGDHENNFYSINTSQERKAILVSLISGLFHTQLSAYQSCFITATKRDELLKCWKGQ